jgi:hypothetical protein
MRALRWVFGVAVVVVCLLVVGGGVAMAVPASFGGVGEESGQFGGPNGVAVEQESGDVYVADTGNQRVDKFGPGGEFLFAWGWGVADGHTEAPQTCTTDCFTGVYGGGSGELRSPAGVAVDNDPLSASYRDVYVVDTANARVEKFDSAGNFLLAFGGGVNETTSGDVCLAGEACRAGTGGSEPGEFEGLHESGGVAVDAAGNVFVGDLNRVQEFSAGGVSVAQIALPGTGYIKALVVDAGGDVYMQGSELSGVRKFEGCAGACTGVELGEPRDASGEFGYFARDFLSLGAAGELFVADGVQRQSDHVREFDPSGAEVASFDAGTEGGELGIAFSSGIGGLYVLDLGKVRVVGVPPAGPLIVNATGAELQPTTASVNAVVNPEGHETTYHMEYGTTVAYGSSTPPASLAGSAFEDEPVSVALSGLQPRTTYHFRVVASNSAGTTFGEDQTFTTLPPALIDSESVSGVTATSATLAAQLNPLGRDTTYRFEYGTDTSYGTSVPVLDGDAGSGASDVPLSALVENLTPGTVYHFRVVASNSLGVVVGVDRVFSTQGAEAPVLPDGRAWEMVSPPDKGGYALDGIGLVLGADIQAAADGRAITYMAHGPVGAEPKGNRSAAYSQVFSSRSADGWSSLDITTPHEAVTGATDDTFTEYQVFSPDLSVGLLAPNGFTPLAPSATEKTPYLREASGEYVPLVTAGNVPPGTKFGQIEENGTPVGGDVVMAGVSPDLRHVVLTSGPPLTEGIVGIVGRENLFEWFGGSLRLVSVLPDGKAASEEGTAALGFQGANVRHAVSDDGSRVFWAGVNGSSGAKSLYMRDVSRGETVQLNTVQPGARGGPSSPQFTVASSDGSRVFFKDTSQLTPDSTAKGGFDLYMCEIVEVAGKLACRLKDLTVDSNQGESANVLGTAIGAGEDGRYVYFVANGVLAAGATPGACPEAPRPGVVCNLYLYDAVAGVTRFIAQLSGEDASDWYAVGGQSLHVLTAGVSPDGRYLAFMSERSLTGYDNTDAHSGQHDVEVFLYDAGTGRVTCASCNPSGARPQGEFDSGAFPGLLVDRYSGNWSGHWLAGLIPGWTDVGEFEDRAYYRSRYLSDSGRLFFDSPDALVPGDGNGAEDVYEYEPSGVGGCTKPGGCVGLLSSGTSGAESAFLDASETGNDVFFLTAARLVGQDLDGALDVYDARVCSVSSPCLTSPPAPGVPCATADSCRAAPSSQPGVFGAPPSATFSGAGNPGPGASKPVAKKRVLSVAQRRAVALRKCRAKPRRRRVSCEAQVRRRYRVGVKAKLVVRSSPIRKGNG